MRAVGHRRVLRLFLALAIAFAGITLGCWVYLAPEWRYIHGEWWMLPLLLLVDGVPMLFAAYLLGGFDT